MQTEDRVKFDVVLKTGKKFEAISRSETLTFVADNFSDKYLLRFPLTSGNALMVLGSNIDYIELKA